MKKILCLLLILTMSLSLIACSGSEGDKETASEQTGTTQKTTEKQKKEDIEASEELKLNEQIIIKDYAKLTFKSVTTTDTVRASMSSYSEHEVNYKVDDDENLYVDAVFDIEYLGSSEIMCTEFMVASAVGKNGATYEGNEDILYCVETDKMSNIASYESIKPLAEARFHAAVEVPKSEKKITLLFNIEGELYSFNYTTGKDVRDATPLDKGSVFEEENFAKAEFAGVSFKESVAPSNGEAGSEYYPDDNADNIYLVVECDVTNNQTEEQPCNSFVGFSATFDGKYKYSGTVTAENSDGTAMSSLENIAPGETRRVLCVIEVPKTVENMDYDINILFNKNDYVYSGTAVFEAESAEADAEETDAESDEETTDESSDSTTSEEE